MAEGGMTVGGRHSTLSGAGLEGLLLARIENRQGPPLEIEGLFEGTYKPGEGISFRASVDMLAPFEYRAPAIEATLKPGGAIGVKVERSEFKKGEFCATGEVDLAVRDSDAPSNSAAT